MAYRDAPMEPVSGTEETDALKDELKFQKRKAEAKRAKEEYKKKKKVEDTAASEDAYMGGGMVQAKYNKGGKVEGYKNGGIVRGCKGLQVSGKGFKGVF